MTPVDTLKALERFEAKLHFTALPLELYEMIRNNEDINVIDVREACDFAAGHIPGAISLPISTWSTAFGLTADKVNVIYGHSQARRHAAAASKYFAQRGYYVMELDGGFEQWQRHDLPVV